MAPSYRVRQKIRKGPPRLLRALVAPRSGRDAAVAAWAEEELEESERAEAQRWIRDNRESLLAGALEELIGLRERCAQRDEAERRFLGTLLEHLEAGELRGEYTDSSGLCLPHLERALRSAPPQARRFLVEAESEKLNRLVGELSEIIRKNDYRFRDEPWGAERDAGVRSTGKLKGEKRDT